MNKKILADRYRYSNKSNLKFKKNIDNKNYDEFILKYPRENHWNKIDCFICNNRDFEIISELDCYGYYHPTGFCNNCGNIQQTEYMNDATLQIFYKDYFRKIYDFRTPLESFNFTKYNRSYDVFNFTNLIIKPKKVLDVGCGTGGLLSIFKEKGCEVLGLDFNDEYLSIAKINKINVKKGSLNILKKNDKFDLIILSHVLEHVLNPDLFLKETTNYLSTNGVIYIEVPSLNSILNGVYDYDLRNYLHNTHISNFSIESLKLLGKKTGLKMIKSNDLIQSCWIKSLNEDINDQDRNYTVKANQLLIKKIEQKRKNIITKIKIPFLKLRNILTKILEKLKIKNKIKYLFYSK